MALDDGQERTLAHYCPPQTHPLAFTASFSLVLGSSVPLPAWHLYSLQMLMLVL